MVIPIAKRIGTTKSGEKAMKTLLSLALFLMIGAAAFAGRGWYVIINNETGNNVNIYPGGSDNWNLYDFGNNQSLEPYEAHTFYTEDKSDWVVEVNAGIVGINIDYGYGSQHVEMWNDLHDWS